MKRESNDRKKADEKTEAQKKNMTKQTSQENEKDEGFKRNIDDEPPMI